VKEAAPAMTPKFYPVEEGYKIILAKSPKDDPVLKYRKEVHRKVEQGQGRLSSFAERMLINKQNEWGISAEIAKQIRDEVLQPYREYERKLAEYEQALRESVKAGEIQYPFSPSIEADLQEYRQYLKLKESDIIAIEAKILLPLKIEYEESLKKVNTIVSEPELKSNLITEDLGNNVKLEMVTIPAGSFTMGSDESDYDDEKPQHQVKLQEFYLGKYPVTQEQYQAIMGNNPSKFKDNPKNPVELVSWDDAQEFCQKLNQKTGKKYRLPTEAEWEYACRAGTQTRYYFGDDEKQLGEYAWFDKNSDSKTHPVGQKKPNNWGLHDMSGNVWEWCEDPWHDSYANKPEDIKNNGNSIWSDSNESRHILRGGSWNDNSGGCRSAVRDGYDADFGYYYYGFRLVLCSF
jgi:formylglycine-generating enzyme required for sulfatase activity